jgi:serine/threonine protein kinase
MVRMFRPGERIDRYTLVRRIGAGGFGEVWSVRADNVPGEYALKFLHHPPDVETAGGPSIEERFVSEANTLMRLDHPGIVRVIDIVDHRPKILGYVMEKLDGVPLGALKLNSLGVLLGIFRRVAEALAYVHKQGLLHRDVKANNIIVGRPRSDGTSFVKLIDFGIAKDRFETNQSTGLGMLVGTLRGTAPESLDRLNGMKVELSGAIDQWGLGVMIYHTLSDRFPFDGGSMLALMEAIKFRSPAPLSFRRELDTDVLAEDISDLVNRMLQKRPEQRFATMDDVAEALGELEHHILSGSTLVSPSQASSTLGPSISIPFAIDVDVEALFSEDSFTADEDDETGLSVLEIIDRVSIDRPTSDPEPEADKHGPHRGLEGNQALAAYDWSEDDGGETLVPPPGSDSKLVALPLPDAALASLPYDRLPQASRSRTEPMAFPALGIRPHTIRVEPVEAPTLPGGAPAPYREVIPITARSGPVPDAAPTVRRSGATSPPPPPPPSASWPLPSAPPGLPSASRFPFADRTLNEARGGVFYWMTIAAIALAVGTVGFLAGRFL